ncbi:leucyl aminopeptidase [Ignicoccus islandicus DSM 13165]|uniref:Leucyl aminopeptidase n=1 Tax=Ignicoccus islandicus DSM 13165 TaxID=940295 RepID=A0A0U2WM82_9CREN|nr:leucyl aminopeptidase [Ignicoccus islandicus DSM 13165]
MRDVDDPYPIITGTALTSWQFDKYKSNKKERRIYFVVDNCERGEVKRALLHSEAQMFARELASEPPNQLNPSTFPKLVMDQAKGLPIDVTVLDQDDLKKEGLELLLAVGKGSDIPPKLLILHYDGEGRRVGLVGKGVTFDSGGYNLKPANYMKNMHADMSGAAVAAAATIWAAKLGLKVKLTTIVPLAENLVSGRAYKMEDVIRSYSGKYVHIGNTDAEGRLILADALTYIKKFSPQVTFTLATLTGAQIIALGYDIAALYSTSDDYAKLIEEASKYTGELVWRMPLYEKYRSDLDHPVADMTNISSKRQAGSIIGALFLKEFAPDPWVYLDIAGPAMAHEANVRWASPYPTGWGTRLMLKSFESI